MQTKTLKNGFEIPVLGMGTWPMGGYRTRDDSKDAEHIDVLKYAIEQGVTHFDTAELYGRGHSEELLGEAIKGVDRSTLFVASKASRDSLRSKEAVISACKASLERVGTDYFDLYYLHWRIPEHALKHQIEALEYLYEEGLIKNIGVSNFNTESLKEAQALCKYPIVANQVHYNFIFRGPERDGLLQYCQENDVILVAYRPVELGKLANTGNPAMLDLADKYKKPHAQLAINWLISQKNVVTIFASLERKFIDENIGSLGWNIEDEDIERARKEYGGQIDVSDSVPLA